MNHFISLLDHTTDTLNAILDEADSLYRRWQTNDMPPALRNQHVGLWFADGLVSQTAFEFGIRAMSGDSVCLNVDTLKNKDLGEFGPYLANWCTLLVSHHYDHKGLAAFAGGAGIPVINSQSSHNAPCRVMGDLQYIRRRRGTLDGLRVVFVGRVDSVCRSWFEAVARWPILFTQVAPEKYLADETTVLGVNAHAAGTLATTTDLNRALNEVDVLVVDEWPLPMHVKEFSRIQNQFMPYQVRPEHLARLRDDSLFLPSPSVAADREVSLSAMQSPLRQTVAAANFLLHSQNAILKLAVEGALTASADRH